MKLGDLRWKASTMLNGNKPEPGHSVLRPEVTVYGHLDSTGEVRIQGNVIGSVSAPRVVLDPDGYLEGEVIAQDVCLHGRFNGCVYAITVAIEATATVEGRIFHHKVTVAQGAHLDGRMPWRPVNYFENLVHEHHGDDDEHVHEK